MAATLTDISRWPPSGGALVDEIITYSASVRRSNHRCRTTQCPRCGKAHEQGQPFKRHAFRSRQFLVILDRVVETVDCLLVRWRCPSCRRTFTEYPRFALPHKHYVLPQMADRALRYVEDDGTSYRKGVLDCHLPVFHPEHRWSSVKRNRSPEVMSHSSLYHWVSSLGRLALEVVWLGRDQRGSAFMPAEWKFTTRPRKTLLIACRVQCRSTAIWQG